MAKSQSSNKGANFINGEVRVKEARIVQFTKTHENGRREKRVVVETGDGRTIWLQVCKNGIMETSNDKWDEQSVETPKGKRIVLV